MFKKVVVPVLFTVIAVIVLIIILLCLTQSAGAERVLETFQPAKIVSEWENSTLTLTLSLGNLGLHFPQDFNEGVVHYRSSGITQTLRDMWEPVYPSLIMDPQYEWVQMIPETVDRLWIEMAYPMLLTWEEAGPWITDGLGLVRGNPTSLEVENSGCGEFRVRIEAYSWPYDTWILIDEVPVGWAAVANSYNPVSFSFWFEDKIGGIRPPYERIFLEPNRNYTFSVWGGDYASPEVFFDEVTVKNKCGYQIFVPLVVR